MNWRDALAFRAGLSEFLFALADVESLDQIAERTLAIGAEYGLTAAASGLLTGGKAATMDPFHFTRWPSGYLARYLAGNLQAVDPVARWARSSGSPAAYTQIVACMSTRDPGHEVVRLARDHGCNEGICVPMRAADGAIGLFAMAGDRAPLEPLEIHTLAAIGTAAFRAAERIDRSADKAHVAPILTTREIGLMPFLLHGHSDREIARLNNISEATVRFHLKNARLKVGAVSRTHLAAKIVALGFASL